MDPSTRRSGAVRSEINVTPLVDVCLVLLIIFMVVTPLLDNGGAELPETNHPQRMAERSEDVVLSVDQNLRTLVDEKPVAAADLSAALREIHTRSPARQLVVKADRRLAYGQVRALLRAAQQGGFSGAGLAVRAKTPAVDT